MGLEILDRSNYSHAVSGMTSSEVSYVVSQA